MWRAPYCSVEERRISSKVRARFQHEGDLNGQRKARSCDASPRSPQHAVMAAPGIVDDPAAAPDDAAMTTITLLVFSKDRAWQLSEFLRSLVANLPPCVALVAGDEGGARAPSAPDGRERPRAVVQALVLYAASTPAFEKSYSEVASRYESRVAFVDENSELAGAAAGAAQGSPSRGFAAHLLNILQVPSDFVLFGVDDMVWLREVDLCHAAEVLSGDAGVFGFHFRLGMHITYCHPANAIMSQPQFHLNAAGALRTPPHAEDLAVSIPKASFAFELRKGSHDWNYPWDVTGTMYRAADALSVVRTVADSAGIEAIGHPNKLEFSGDKLLSAPSTSEREEVAALRRRAVRCACPARAVVAVLTVNRVQDVYDNPVFSVRREGLVSDHPGSPGAGGAGAVPASTIVATDVEALDALLWRGSRLDLQHYSVTTFSSVHIGDFVLESDSLGTPGGSDSDAGDADDNGGVAAGLPAAGEAAEADPSLSVLIPAYNAAPFVRQALDSVISQSYDDWEAVVVDDGSSDDTFKIASEAAAVDAARGRIRVVRNTSNLGLVMTLNIGRALCRGDLLARMDADDVCTPDRFALQVAYLRSHPAVDVVGTSVMTFAESDDPDATLQLGRIIVHPTSPLSVRWNMLSFCCLAHPTVMMRRAVLDVAGGYSSSAAHAEDYELWLRMMFPSDAKSGVASIRAANLGDVALLLRKHGANASTLHAEAQLYSSVECVAGALSRLLGRTISIASAACIMRGCAAFLDESDGPGLVKRALTSAEVTVTADAVLKACEALVDAEAAVVEWDTGEGEAPAVVSGKAEREAIGINVVKRLGELATAAMAAFGIGAMGALGVYNRRKARGSATVPAVDNGDRGSSVVGVRDSSTAAATMLAAMLG